MASHAGQALSLRVSDSSRWLKQSCVCSICLQKAIAEQPERVDEVLPKVRSSILAVRDDGLMAIVVGKTKTPFSSVTSWLNAAKDIHDAYEKKTPGFFVPRRSGLIPQSLTTH